MSMIFYGKKCNFAFPSKAGSKYRVVFNSKQKRIPNITIGNIDVELLRLSYELLSNVDTAILWAAYCLLARKDLVNIPELIKPVICESTKGLLPEPTVMEFPTMDELIEAAWDTLEDINIDDYECTEQDWFVFPKGTPREDIWHWFDEHHSKGLAWLFNERE